jgi:hypothetical protein
MRDHGLRLDAAFRKADGQLGDRPPCRLLLPPPVPLAPARSLLPLVPSPLRHASTVTAVSAVPDGGRKAAASIALLFLAQSPRVDLRAVTVSGTGLVHCPVGTRNAAQMLAFAGRPDVPLDRGRQLPLAEPERQYLSSRR